MRRLQWSHDSALRTPAQKSAVDHWQYRRPPCQKALRKRLDISQDSSVSATMNPAYRRQWAYAPDIHRSDIVWGKCRCRNLPCLQKWFAIHHRQARCEWFSASHWSESALPRFPRCSSRIGWCHRDTSTPPLQPWNTNRLWLWWSAPEWAPMRR